MFAVIIDANGVVIRSRVHLSEITRLLSLELIRRVRNKRRLYVAEVAAQMIVARLRKYVKRIPAAAPTYFKTGLTYAHNLRVCDGYGTLAAAA